MKKKITAYERERLKYINYTMDELYDLLDNISENLVDKEYSDTIKDINKLIKSLEEIKESI